MRRRTDPQRLSPSQRAGLVAAAGSVPVSLTPSLRPRSGADQGLVTGLAAALDYALTAAAHDAVLGTSRAVRGLLPFPVDTRGAARTTAAADAAAAAVTSVVEAALPWRADEPLARAAVRTAAQRLRAAALAGLVPGLVDVLPHGGGRLGAAIRSVPGAVVVGTGISAAVQLARARGLAASGAPVHPVTPPPAGRTLVVGATTTVSAVAFAALERRVAHGADRAIRRTTGAQGLGGLASHLLSVAAIGTVAAGTVTWLARRAEAQVHTPDAPLGPAPTSPAVSGGPGSAVAWAGLGREGRRYLASAPSAAAIADVVGEPARTPLRLYVGLHSAPDDAGRVALAMAEVERTRALDRALVVLCAPTGSGYVPHTALSAWEHLSLGDCCTVTLQYAERPSILSLDRVDAGRSLMAATVAAFGAAVAARPAGSRPRLVIFGESLGAHTSQDAFLHTGTEGLRRAGVDRALWLGTPWASGWAQEVRYPRPDVVPGDVLHVSSADELDELAPAIAARARYVLIGHDDDGVTLATPRLLLRCPPWLAHDRPAAVPPQATWSTPTTFLQTVVDAKNGGTLVPGEFTSHGHDYRADAARAVRFAFDLPCPDTRLAAVEAALRREDVARGERWSGRSAVTVD